MSRTKALTMYLVGALGQILTVCIAVFILRALGFTVGYSTPIGWIAIAFGGLEEIGWRYLFQPLLQERIHYIFATIITFVAWAAWHFLFFYLEETKADAIPFLLGLLINSFILSALYVKTKNLWICAMTHSLINVLSQITSGGNRYLGIVTRVAIIILAVLLVSRTNKQDNNS